MEPDFTNPEFINLLQEAVESLGQGDNIHNNYGDNNYGDHLLELFINGLGDSLNTRVADLPNEGLTVLAYKGNNPAYEKETPLLYISVTRQNTGSGVKVVINPFIHPDYARAVDTIWAYFEDYLDDAPEMFELLDTYFSETQELVEGFLPWMDI